LGKHAILKTVDTVTTPGVSLDQTVY